ncbi:hypothetical protein TNCV_2998171 [Trichonephila clavipes]|nr:hypothetical protein TNCV_2998171 [Trichonephila clavipes]
MDEILTTARDLELEVNEDDIEELIMGHEDELTFVNIALKQTKVSLLAVTMTSHNHLDDFLKWRAVFRLEASQSQAEVARSLQEAQKWSPSCRMNSKQVVLSTRKLARDFAAMSGRRISKQTLYSRLAETVHYARRQVLCAHLTASYWK